MLAMEEVLGCSAFFIGARFGDVIKMIPYFASRKLTSIIAAFASVSWVC